MIDRIADALFHYLEWFVISISVAFIVFVHILIVWGIYDGIRTYIL